MHGEDDLEEAKDFSVKHLKSLIGKMDVNLAEQVQESLEFPLRWRMPRLEARSFIHLYEMDDAKILLLLELTKLDYNLVQSVHQKEVKELTKWDIHAIDELPDYMKTCYLAMFNFGNEIVYNVLRDHDVNVVYHIHEVWGNLCTSYLVEARWFYSVYTPTLDEYLQTAWISVGGPGGMAHAYLLLGSPITKTCLDSIQASSEPVYGRLSSPD
ncbi:trans-ocimene synthase, chloroplastic-like [Actinidia eriantha]|uniref:trans-ocimene synthase, chloroplastic-like n=1 Tax=Actinidia eriantha TaxID=165200 RepID=UPI00258A1704|nr:trans-ocimene synthase, chloroplastic-like [Actinidia eriantha]